ncbi:MAG: magnesium transporter, partial [Sulfurimonas sp.]
MDALKKYLDSHSQDELHPSEIANLLKDLNEKDFEEAISLIPKEIIADVAL